jgi:L-alanine-DL-glutamate epimerase-like enolase superfamily enzyme
VKIAEVRISLLRYRLAQPIGGSGVASVDLVLACARTDAGVEGTGFSYVLGGGGAIAAGAARQMADDRVAGRQFDHPEATWRGLAASLNRTRRGPNFIGLAAIDVALWDAYARVLGVPLGVAMGGAPREIPVYGSGGYDARQGPEEAAATACAQVIRGFRGVKLRVAARREDEAVIRAVRDAVPTETEVMVDANEKGTASTAARLLATARAYGVLFVEEPLPADDLAGYRALSRTYPRTVATGEHVQGVAEALPFIAEGLCGVMQPDLAMMGGLSGSLQVARLAESFGLEIAPHFLPGLFVHLAAASPAVTWLEDFPLLEPLFDGWPPLRSNGMLALLDTPGHGLRIAEGAEREFGVEA